jgi:hypothetical protein
MINFMPLPVLLIILILSSPAPALSQDAAGGEFSLLSKTESRAFQHFQSRPVSELSKLLYLVDRLGEKEVEIIYEKKSYPSHFVRPVARWYVSQHYNKKDSAKDWLSKWCYRSIGSGEPVWVKNQNGSLRAARDILLEELGHLDSLFNPAGTSPEKIL